MKRLAVVPTSKTLISKTLMSGVLIGGVLAVASSRCGAQVRTKSCGEIASFVAGAAAAQGTPIPGSQWSKDLNCAAANSIPADAELRLAKISRNTALRRWEFTLRCGRPEECVPSLVWAHDGTAALSLSRVAKVRGDSREDAKAGVGGSERLVAPGQTATLTWEQGGIRVALPVTCLEAGALGQFVRVRFKNVARVLRAEVVGQARLRVSL
jgi:hypothetical protein